MATTSSKGRSTGGSKARKSGGAARNVSLSETDKKYVQESIGDAARRGLAAVGTGASSLFEALGEFGLNSERVERLREALGDIEVRESVEKAQEYLAEQIEGARDYARENPKKVIGGAAGVLVGASLLALALRRASGEGSKSKKSSGGGSKKKSAKSSSSKQSSKKSSKKASKRR
jgi:hypothetical protein